MNKITKTTYTKLDFSRRFLFHCQKTESNFSRVSQPKEWDGAELYSPNFSPMSAFNDRIRVIKWLKEIRK